MGALGEDSWELTVVVLCHFSFFPSGGELCVRHFEKLFGILFGFSVVVYEPGRSVRPSAGE
jgi:hypothetical protein